MQLKIQTPKEALSLFFKQNCLRSEIDLFKKNLVTFLDKINIIENQPHDESEAHLKNDFRDFLRDTYYHNDHAFNLKGYKDLVIHLGKTTDSEVAVIIETKRPSNKSEMISEKNLNKKAFHELILYYLDERIKHQNIQVKNLIISNINEWYIFDANEFDKHIYRNSLIKKLYETKIQDKKDNPFFYEEISKILAKTEDEISCIYFNIRDYEEIVRNINLENEKELIPLFKVLSPSYLLKLANPYDGNYLDEQFYRELLHILGLEEVKDGGKNIIRRKAENRHEASFIENCIQVIEGENVFYKPFDFTGYGDTKEERLFSIALELCLTWVNRVLFLKLLEGQLKSYHKHEEKEYSFLNINTIKDFDELFKLFHHVLAVPTNKREPQLKSKYQKVPYLNSSLFEINDLESYAIKVKSLDKDKLLPLFSSSILKKGKNDKVKLPTLQYLFEFLDAYDFASEGVEDIKEERKTIINASVLGKVFEKINGYKDGSIFTPAFITMYMCREAIEKAVIQKFNSVKNWNVTTLMQLHRKIEDRVEANKIINTLKICDPAVGSGHFLVAALNELILIKYKLHILDDADGNPMSRFRMQIENDELVIYTYRGDVFKYNPRDVESTSIQKMLFHEKQTLIENCLFGVDINPNSVKICRLRLWIELLKNAYYKDMQTLQELETLPNIDINIKCGNSLLSRFELNADLTKVLKSVKYDINTYRGFVNEYKNCNNKEVKEGLEKLIAGIKSSFRTEIAKFSDPRILKLQRLSAELFLRTQDDLFNKGIDKKNGNGDGNGVEREKIRKMEEEVNKLSKELDEEKNNVALHNAFEWRFEFPEVLSDNGDFEGFDAVIGNPPYIQLQSMGKVTDALEKSNYQTFTRTGDIYPLFYERGNTLLKNNGILAFITSNKWMRADYGINTRKFLSEKTNPIILIDFGMVLVFNNATVLTNILMFEKKPILNQLLAARTPSDFDIEKDNLYTFYHKNSTKLEINENAWIVSNKDSKGIKDKVITQGIVLKNWNIKINYGIKTGYNQAFIIDEQTKNKLIAEDAKSKEFIKPILRGQDIKVWMPKFANLWVIFIPKGFTINGFSKNKPPKSSQKNTVLKVDIAWDWFQRNYTSISNHLSVFKTNAEVRQDKGDFWWEQRACTYLLEFSKPKIIYPNMTKFLPFVYDEEGFYTNQKCFIITSEEKCLKYLTAFFNSKLFKYCFKDNFPELLGDTFELSKVFFEQIPIKQISKEEQKPFEKLVDKIIVAKKAGKSSLAFEKQVDELVYQLYNITEEERNMIDTM